MDDSTTKNVLSTKEASELSGYNADYLGSACRAGKIKAEHIGRQWFIDRASLVAFITEQDTRKKEIIETLSRARTVEYKEASITPQHPLPVPVQRALILAPMRTTLAAFAVLAVISFGAYAGLAGVSPEQKEFALNTKSGELAASPLSAFTDFFENVIGGISFILNPTPIELFHAQVPVLVRGSTAP
jgi:hypothetical protein